MAMLIQTLSAKLGIATGINLAEHCRAQFRARGGGMWVIMELVAMATDLAEFLGAALGFNLLFGIPLLARAAHGHGHIPDPGSGALRLPPLEVVITGAGRGRRRSYLMETVLDRPDWSSIAIHAVVPRFRDGERAPRHRDPRRNGHASRHLSALRAHAGTDRRPGARKTAPPIRFEVIDVMIAMGLAKPDQRGDAHHGRLDLLPRRDDRCSQLEEAYDAGAAARAGGQHYVRRLPPGRRAFLGLGRHEGRAGHHAGLLATPHAPVGPTRGDDGPFDRRNHNRARSDAYPRHQPGGFELRLPFAIIPLIVFTRRRDIMGSLVNRPSTTVMVSLVAVLIIALNGFLLYQLFLGG